MESTMSDSTISEQEKQSGAYRIWHRFGDKDVRGRSLAELFERDGGQVLEEMLRWKHLGERFPETKGAIKRFFEVPRIAAILKFRREQEQESKTARRSANTWADRERNIERGY
jgi:hypothetical protein